MIIYTSDLCLAHNMGAQHPECPERLGVILQALKSSRIAQQLTFATPDLFTLTAAAAHDNNYIKHLEQLERLGETTALDPDTLFMAETLTAARAAAGAGVSAIDAIMSEQTQQAFAAVRPPGHHALHNRAMGFCFINNIAVAAHHAMTHYGLERIAIIDFDVHHGNGSENIVANDPRILLCSAFQHPFYPNTDLAQAADNIVHIPLAAGTAGTEFRQAMQQLAFARVKKFTPQLILVSAGFDGHRRDPLAGWNLVDDDYFWLGATINRLAKDYSHGRVLSMLEGGYALDTLGGSVLAYIEGMLS